MNQNSVEVKLIEVLQSIQSDSGYDASGIIGNTCPVNDLEGFDSMIWPVAIGMLAAVLDVEIPNAQNIFISPDGKRPLTISESASLLCEVISIGEK